MGKQKSTDNEMISIPKKELERLRELLDSAFEILKAYGIYPGAEMPPKVPKQKRVPFQKGIDNYMKLIESGKKNTSPYHLRNRKN
ncbi:MAG: hypothetical protein KDC62_08740 [Aequorivita sp.]|nr:hypothetical protein [Aequorivita sp.]